MDDSSFDSYEKQPGMKRQSSEADLAADFLGIPSSRSAGHHDKSKSASKHSLIDRFENLHVHVFGRVESRDSTVIWCCA